MTKFKLAGTMIALTAIGGITLAILAAEPLRAAMAFDKPAAWTNRMCQVVNTVNSAWENEARYVKGGGRQFEWHGIAGDLDDKTREHLTRELVVWLRSHSGQQVAEVEHKPPSSNSCQDVTAYSRPAVRGDLAFVATAYSCGFDCTNGQVIALRKSWIGWLPIARADTWIS